MTFMSSYAQENFTLKGKVYDFKTRTELPGAIVQLMRTDSTVVTTTTALSQWTNNDQTGETSDFSLNVPRQNATYIIKCSLLGYKTTYMTVSLTNLKKREFSRELPPFLMREDSKLLKEVVVSSTKVQFYYRGDTVVYNADAFVMAEGSMLDALVHQLPGVEIRENGDIYHNGRLVKSLLLNGKDFFKNDKKVMFDNLPTYTVKQIEVYDKIGKRSQFVGYELPDDKEYVMDVKLKKEYSIGWIANTEVGSGIAESSYTGDNPYLARLFAMRFTNHSQVAFYGNANNLSDERRPGQDDRFKPENMSAGSLTQQLAGISYSVDARNKKWTFGGDVNFSRKILHGEEETDRTNFLSSGDTYEHIRNNSHDKNLAFFTDNRLDYDFKQVQLRLRHSLLYNKFDRKNNMESEAWGDTLFNRYYSNGLMRGHNLMTGLKASSIIKFKNNTLDHIEADASFLYNERKDDTFKHYDLYLGSVSKPTQQATQFYRNHPDRNYTLEASVAYERKMNKAVHMSLRYGVKHTEANRDSRLYIMDQLDDYTQGDMGILPSVAELASMQDLRNSYESQTVNTDHTITPSLYFYSKTEKGNWGGQVFIPLTIRHNRLDYMRGAIDTTLTRTSTLVGFHNTQINWRNKDNSQNFRFRYWLTPKTPDLLNMVNMRDDTDPLNIHEGNAKLKNSYQHRASISYALTVKQNYNYSWLLEAGLIDNAIAMGYSYDAATGIRTYRAYNVDGNWNVAFRNGLMFRKKRFTFSSALNYSHQQNVDFLGVNGKVGQNTVKTDGVSTKINAGYTFGRYAIGAKFDGGWKHVSSNSDDFTNLNIWNCDYGLTATFQLPYHFQLSTDVTMYSRRGYHDASLNTDEIMWNTRLSYAAMNGNLIFMLDGFDILAQLSNVTYTLNGQGRTEIRRNVLPQYVLFHIQYRLNKQPKKNKQEPIR